MNEIENYIMNCDNNVQILLFELRQIIVDNSPQVTEKIAWKMPTFVLNGKNLIHFASYKNHIGIYPGAEAIHFFREKLEGYKTSKGAIRFLYINPLPTLLIADIVQYCVRENIVKTTIKNEI